MAVTGENHNVGTLNGGNRLSAPWQLPLGETAFSGEKVSLERKEWAHQGPRHHFRGFLGFRRAEALTTFCQDPAADLGMDAAPWSLVCFLVSAPCCSTSSVISGAGELLLDQPQALSFSWTFCCAGNNGGAGAGRMCAPQGDPCYLHQHPLLRGQVCFKDPGFLLLLPLSDCSACQGYF